MWVRWVRLRCCIRCAAHLLVPLPKIFQQIPKVGPRPSPMLPPRLHVPSVLAACRRHLTRARRLRLSVA
ncbi:hypothetical protein PR002_g4471 [Phytophthora rubi]|uniref:Secreted protein n=1 Tax=Phytophthora rubi TaxID=129364 RepID=A0A6A3N7D0_9STRA|nr:hypothetical protein PR002_g4471 [Phytophthora rubi]